LRKERERTELRIREGVRAEVRNEVADELTVEYASEI